MAYDHKHIDSKWQQKWSEQEAFTAPTDPHQPKFYALDMFPYPSGAGLHVGHLASYTPTDIVARYKRAQGYNVLHPMGYDAFGLPAEQYAIKTGIHPAETTYKAIENFRRQLKSFGYSFDWNREISTCDPQFYKWTQYIFLKLYERGLAYQKEMPVNWCPALRTVLANEEVIDGKSERGGHPVVRKPMRQWMLKITAYAERLLQDLDEVDWPEETKEGQRNWIGKSEGASIVFQVDGVENPIEVFTTRPDTLFGATFMVLAPEHPMVSTVTTSDHKQRVDEYMEASAMKSEVDRKAQTEKSGVFSGTYAINPVNNQKLPIFIADYVLMDYGTGAIMCVPGHDKRDFDFAKQFNLPVERVLASDSELPFEGDGELVNSDFLNGLSQQEAFEKIIQHLEDTNCGYRKIQYKLRDWLFSRQRYWGEPFPIIHFESGPQPVSQDELPVLLPEVADYEPTEEGEPPLARVEDFVRYKDPTTGTQGRRDTNTMPGSAGSSWYFLRFTDPHNTTEPFSYEAQQYWMPVDLYVGGAEHTVGHLLYARFWHKVLYDAGLVSTKEPFQRLAHQGAVLAPDGGRMSKSKGNTINPDDVRDEYGADATRMYISFMGPFDKDKPWSSESIQGVRRFLDRVWRLCVDENGESRAENAEPPIPLKKNLHKTIKKVTKDIQSLDFNTAVSAMMSFVNDLYKEDNRSYNVLMPLVQLLMPFAPHLAEELWERMGGKGLASLAPWPQYDETLAADELMTTAVQVNGKTRGTIDITENTGEQEAAEKAKQIASVNNALTGKNIVKLIYKPGKILNFIAK